MITTCLGSAAMQNVDDSSATTRRNQASALMDHAAESTDDSERIRRDCTSVKSTTAFQFWSSYVGECGSGRGGPESASPHSVERQSNGTGRDASNATMPSTSSSCVAPATDKLNTILNRSVDLACFTVNHSSSDEDHQASGPGEEPSVSSTPRVSCSIEVTGRRGHSRTYSVVPKSLCRPNQDTTVQNQRTMDSMDMRENEGLATTPSQESEVVDGLTPDPTLSIVSSSYEEGLTPDPTISIQSSYVPASYSNLAPSKPAQSSSLPRMPYSQQMLPTDPASSGTTAASLRCHPDSSPTFSHYSLLIGKGSADSDDLFAALSSSTKSGASVRDLQLPVSSLSATTFLSSPSATTVDGSDRLQVDVATSAVEVPVPTSTKSTFSTAISSMSSFSIDEPNSKSSKSGAHPRSYLGSATTNAPESKSLKPEHSAASTDATSTSLGPLLGIAQTENIVVKKGFPTSGNDKSWIRKGRDMIAPVSESEIKKEGINNVLLSDGSHGSTDLTAQETMSTSQTMEDTLVVEITESSEGNATQVSSIPLRTVGAEEPAALPGADPFEWAYEIWRAKGLLSARKNANDVAAHSSNRDSHSQKHALESIAQQKCETTQRREATTEDGRIPVHHLRSSRISDSHSQPATSKDSERVKDDNFSTILQRWRKKSDARPDPEQDQKAFVRETVTRVEECELVTEEEDQTHDAELGEVWESFESATNEEQTSHTRDVWSPFIPRPPSPKNKQRSPSPGIRRSPSQHPSSPCPAYGSPRKSSSFTPQASSERPPLPFSGSGKKVVDSPMKPIEVGHGQEGTQSSPQVERRPTPTSPRQLVNDDMRRNESVQPVKEAGTIMAGKGCESTIAAPTSQPTKRNVALPKSNSDYKTAVQTFLHAVEKNDLDLLKSFSNKSDDEKVEKAVGMQPTENVVKPSMKDRRKPWHDFGRTVSNAPSSRGDKSSDSEAARSNTSHPIPVRKPESEQPRKKNSEEARALSNTDESIWMSKSSVNVRLGQTNELDVIQRTQGQKQMCFAKPESPLPVERESNSSPTLHCTLKDVQRSRSNPSPSAMFRSPVPKEPERTRLSPGEPLIGKTIQVPSSVKRRSSSVKRRSGYSLNESAESGTWVRLLNLESAGADDSADYEGAEQVRFDETGRPAESHPWRRDMVVRKVNSFDGDFSVRTSLFEEACQCASSAFSGKDELVEFYLPTMGMYV